MFIFVCLLRTFLPYVMLRMYVSWFVMVQAYGVEHKWFCGNRIIGMWSHVCMYSMSFFCIVQTVYNGHPPVHVPTGTGHTYLHTSVTKSASITHTYVCIYIIRYFTFRVAYCCYLNSLVCATEVVFFLLKKIFARIFLLHTHGE